MEYGFTGFRTTSMHSWEPEAGYQEPEMVQTKDAFVTPTILILKGRLNLHAQVCLAHVLMTTGCYEMSSYAAISDGYSAFSEICLAYSKQLPFIPEIIYHTDLCIVNKWSEGSQ